ncbi:MAG: hypothetical protein M0023_12930 [Desulfobacteraceae bacterium]|nr:hypothetical protein [Desulfobacteraceae bacterium]
MAKLYHFDPFCQAIQPDKISADSTGIRQRRLLPESRAALTTGRSGIQSG